MYCIGKKVSEHIVESTKFYYFAKEKKEFLFHCHYYISLFASVEANRFVCNRMMLMFTVPFWSLYIGNADHLVRFAKMK